MTAAYDIVCKKKNEGWLGSQGVWCAITNPTRQGVEENRSGRDTIFTQEEEQTVFYIVLLIYTIGIKLQNCILSDHLSIL